MTLKNKMKLLNSGYSEMKILICVHMGWLICSSIRCCIRYRCLSEVPETKQLKRVYFATFIYGPKEKHYLSKY